jgi:hypothetical protein
MIARPTCTLRACILINHTILISQDSHNRYRLFRNTGIFFSCVQYVPIHPLIILTIDEKPRLAH